MEKNDTAFMAEVEQNHGDRGEGFEFLQEKLREINSDEGVHYVF